MGISLPSAAQQKYGQSRAARLWEKSIKFFWVNIELFWIITIIFLFENMHLFKQ